MSKILPSPWGLLQWTFHKQKAQPLQKLGRGWALSCLGWRISVVLWVELETPVVEVFVSDGIYD